jgi:hypothetical protein
LIEEEKRGKSIAPLESSFEDADEGSPYIDEEDSDENNSGSGGSDDDVEESSRREESSPKVNITG